MNEPDFLISGVVHSVKNTRFTEWIKDKDDSDRILQPVIDKRIHIRLISSAEILQLEILPAPNVKNVISLANYIFNNDAFIGACYTLLLSF